MLTLITGQPGNGKTLKAMALMRAEYDRNQAAVKAGKEEERQFFSNVKGATREENPTAFPWVQRMPDHNDWTKLPHNSYVQYDEAHADGNTPGLERYGKLFPSTGKPGESQDPRIRAMSTHRHFGYDIVLMTQWPSKIHHQVRTLCGEHIHMNRAMGIAAAGVVRWSRVQTDPYDEQQREKAEEEIWSYEKDLYERYISSTHHTAAYKFKLPKKIKNGIGTGVMILVMLIGLFTYMGWWSFLGIGGKQAGEAQAQASAAAAAPAGLPSAFQPNIPGAQDTVTLMPGMGAYSSINTAPAPTLAGCVSSARSCRCFNADGLQIDMQRRECETLLASPMPYNVYHRYERGSSMDPQRPGLDRLQSEPYEPFQPSTRGVGSRFAEMASYGDVGVDTGRYVGQGIGR